MVKLFIGNLPREATEQEIRSLFEQYGKVLECDIIKNYGFVHIEDKTAAEDAIRNLHHHKLHGVCINVEASKNKSKASTKLHVGNISPACTNLELRAKFEEYGPVIECDIVKDYAFVHMERAEDAVEAIRGLDNTEFQGEALAQSTLGWEGAQGGSDLTEFWLILVLLASLCGWCCIQGLFSCWSAGIWLSGGQVLSVCPHTVCQHWEHCGGSTSPPCQGTAALQYEFIGILEYLPQTDRLRVSSTSQGFPWNFGENSSVSHWLLFVPKSCLELWGPPLSVRGLVPPQVSPLTPCLK